MQENEMKNIIFTFILVWSTDIVSFCQVQTTIVKIRRDDINNQWLKRFNGHDSILIDKLRQYEWIKKQADTLKYVVQTKQKINISEPNIINLDDLKSISYRTMGLTAIRCKNKETVFISSHSSHMDHSIGDITVAIDYRKNIYINKGHICGGIINFKRLKPRIAESAIKFFKEFYSDTDDEKWERFLLR